MKTTIYFFLLYFVLFIQGCSERKGYDTKADSIFPKGEKIENDNFNGTAWLTMLASPDSLSGVYAGNVRFEPAARTNWHLHPAGQLLIVISGEGYYQEEGRPKRVLRKGETIKCPPDVRHWHGATPEMEFTHIAVSSNEKGATQWFEPVSDADYNR
ncbi:cupin domain-containing protein [Robiginitalea sp. IMCC44478]|uniref:cupin domain-containing protein n=1 Tax=Robiginitalea sp. IMCC44478 TaxID=3459122 RepID=UPI0040421025